LTYQFPIKTSQVRESLAIFYYLSYPSTRITPTFHREPPYWLFEGCPNFRLYEIHHHQKKKKRPIMWAYFFCLFTFYSLCYLPFTVYAIYTVKAPKRLHIKCHHSKFAEHSSEKMSCVMVCQ